MMKRRAILVLFLLVGGAIINVAVAWGCALAHEPAILDAREETASRTIGRGVGDEIIYMAWTIKKRSAFGSQVIESVWMGPAGGSIGMNPSKGSPTKLLPSWAPELSPETEVPKENSHWYGLARADGWPMHAMYGMILFVTGTEMMPDETWVLQGRVISRGAYLLVPTPSFDSLSFNDLPFLACRPLWAGFAINTIFYAAIAWGLFAVPGAVRRRLRHKRGQCAACGYSLRESVSDRCPECGNTRGATGRLRKSRPV